MQNEIDDPRENEQSVPALQDSSTTTNLPPAPVEPSPEVSAKQPGAGGSSLTITKVRPGQRHSLVIHASQEIPVRPICGGGRDGRKTRAWQETKWTIPTCIRCLKILVKRAAREGIV